MHGRYRSHAGRQRRLRFPRPWNAKHPQGGRVHLSGSARSRVRAARRAEGQALRQGRRRLRWRQEHFLRRSRQGSAVEADDSRQGRTHQHHRADGRRQSADEASQRVHGHRQVLPEFRHHLESRGAKETWATDVRLPGHAPCARGASEDARLDARVCRRSGQDQVPEFASHCEGQSGRSRRAHGVGSDPRRRSRWPAPRSGRTGRVCPALEIFTSIFGRSRIGRARPSRAASATKGDVSAAIASAHKKTHRHVSVALHEARADRPDDGRGRCEDGWHGSRPHPQSESRRLFGARSR